MAKTLYAFFMSQDLQVQLDKAIAHLQKEFTTLQIGRASSALVEEIEVESYGSMMPLKGLANITCPDAKTIKVEPWDKTLLPDIEKSILEANIGLNPQNMGEHLFLPIPPMTEERRKQLVKFVHELAEKAKISIRNARHDELKMVKLQKEENEISEDQQKDLEREVQAMVDAANLKVDESAKHKEKDIMTV